MTCSYGNNHKSFNHFVKTFRFEYAGCGDIPAELFFRGAISLVLTGLNILCIVVVGVLILLVKQVTPEKIPQRNAAFWRKDILLNRQYEKSLQETVEVTGKNMLNIFLSLFCM